MNTLEKSALLQAQVTRLEQTLCVLQSEMETLRRDRTQEAIQRQQVEHQLTASQQLLQLVMDTLPEAIFWKDENSAYLGCNQSFAQDAGLESPQDIIGKTDYEMPWQPEEASFYRECDRRVMASNKAELGIVEPQLQDDGKHAWLETNKVPLHNTQGEVIGILGTYQDITDRKQSSIELEALNQKLEQQASELTAAMEQLKQSQLQLIQQEKMSALGNLMAGIAHEINNPIGFLSGNLKPAQTYVEDLMGLIDLYQQALPQPNSDIEEEIEAIDLAYLREDLPKLFRSMEQGIQRIRKISTSLRTFSRADKEYKVPFDLIEGLEGTILILKHRLKANDHRPAIEVVTNYQEIPPVVCFPGQLNQVFMNLMANAIDAIEEASEGKTFAEIQQQPNRIDITIYLSADQQLVAVGIRDNGIGMEDETKQRVFENLFTTKAVGQGTGLGLAIAHQIIVEKHSGTIDIQSELGKGTEFIIRIPFETD